MTDDRPPAAAAPALRDMVTLFDTAFSSLAQWSPFMERRIGAMLTGLIDRHGPEQTLMASVFLFYIALRGFAGAGRREPADVWADMRPQYEQQIEAMERDL